MRGSATEADSMLDPKHPGASRLNHLGMIYAGAMAEVAQGHPVTFLPLDAPGLKQVRDLIQLVLFTRAEVNGLTNLLIEKELVTLSEVEQQMEDEYEWLAAGKVRQFSDLLGVDIHITDQGLSFGRRR